MERRRSHIFRNQLPGGIWALGFVSLFMDVSSELIHSLLPVFMVTTLGAGAVAVGLVEGFAEATASITKIFSGALSDRLGRRKGLTLLGYGLSALTKPAFALAPTVGWVFTARFADRIGKGIRGAPRDALIAEIAPLDLRGACYGLRQALDTVGAVLGPLAAIGLMALLADDIRLVYGFATIPALAAVLILGFAVREPRRPLTTPTHDPVPARRWRLRHLSRAYWAVVAFGGVLTLARFSEAFLVLRGQSVGLALTLAPMVMVVMSLIYAAAAYPAGALSDRFDRRRLLAFGLLVLLAAHVTLAVADDFWALFAGVALWGLHMGLTQGLMAALVADSAPAELHGTAFGLFYLVSGGLALLASLVAGVLWQTIGAAAPFWAGAGLTAAGLVMLIGWAGRNAHR